MSKAPVQIVITDGDTLNPGDLSWDGLHALGHVVYYPFTPPELVAERCKAANIIVTNKTPIDRTTIQASPLLQLIAVTATGYNIIDVDAARERNVMVCNVPGYGTDSVAQHTIALLLELCNHVGENSHSVAVGEWSQRPWSYSKKPLIELRGKTFGIVGFGKIGERTGEIAHALGMEVLYHNTRQKDSTWATAVSLQTLFEQSDFVSLHCPLTPQNKEFVNHTLLQRMKPSACLINTARGQLINENDLVRALREKRIAGAALDVLSVEPPAVGHPLIGLPNCVITPHTAWLSVEARTRIMDTTIQNIIKVLEGNPQHRVA